MRGLVLAFKKWDIWLPYSPLKHLLWIHTSYRIRPKLACHSKLFPLRFQPPSLMRKLLACFT